MGPLTQAPTNPLFNIPSPLYCVSYTAILVWSVWSDDMRKSSVKPPVMHSSGQIYRRRTAMTYKKSRTLANSRSDKSVESEWFEAASDAYWYESWIETERYRHCHWQVAHTDIYACVLARGWHFEYCYSQWHKLVKALLAVINRVKMCC